MDDKENMICQPVMRNSLKINKKHQWDSAKILDCR